MKNKILKATALFLAAICILSCVCGCGKKTVSTAAKGELTRLKWIEMLSDSFYIQNSKTEDPYFSDVSKENELFGKIQECVELGIISDEKQFNANSSVSFKEAALNCINAIGKSTVSDYLKTDKELSEKELLKFAKEKILTEISDKKMLTQADAEKALKNSTELLLNKPLFEKEKIKLAEGVTDLRNSKAEYTDSSAVLSDVKDIKKDSVIILPPSAEYPAGLARKVASVSGNTVTLGEANIDEVFDEIKVSKRTKLNSTDFTPAAGVTVGEYSAVENTSRTEGASAAPTLLTAQSNNNSYTELASDGKASFDIVLNLTKGELSLDEKWGSLKGSYSDARSPEKASDFKFDGRNLYTEKYKAGYEIKGKISLSDISLDNDVDYKKIAGIKVGVNRCETKVNFKASVNLSVKGKIDDDIDVLTARIPIGVSGLSVKCVFVLSIGANGEISVKSEIRNTTSYIYEKGLKQVNNTDVKNKATVTGKLTAQVGPKAVLSILGMDFFDIQALIGMGAKAEISAEQGSTEIPCVDVKAYAPIVTLKFAGDKKTVLNALGFSAEWKAYDIENGWKKSNVVSTYHWESKKGWVDKCTHPTDDEKSGNQSGNSESGQNNTASVGSKTETPKSNATSGKKETNIPNNSSPSSCGETATNYKVYYSDVANMETYMARVFGSMIEGTNIDYIDVLSVKINGIECKITKKCFGEENVRSLFTYPAEDGTEDYALYNQIYNKNKELPPIICVWIDLENREILDNAATEHQDTYAIWNIEYLLNLKIGNKNIKHSVKEKIIYRGFGGYV